MQGRFPFSNIGRLDRVLRVVIGALLAGMASTGEIGAWGWLGLFAVFTAIIHWCPLYFVLKKNTCTRRSAAPPQEE